MPGIRNKAGQFVKGHSGNPTGRTKENPEIKEILKAASLDAAKKLVELVQCSNEKIALNAAIEILNRTEGKPRESVSMNINGNLDIRSQVRSVLMERLKLNGQSEQSKQAENIGNTE